MAKLFPKFEKGEAEASDMAESYWITFVSNCCVEIKWRKNTVQ